MLGPLLVDTYGYYHTWHDLNTGRGWILSRSHVLDVFEVPSERAGGGILSEGSPISNVRHGRITHADDVDQKARKCI